MSGTHAITGKSLDGLAHLKQSIRDILTTPIGSRVMRRQYGSQLFDLIDAPTNRRAMAAIYAATAGALRTWEPRFKLQQVNVDAVTPGSIKLTADGLYVYGDQPTPLSVTVEVTA
ncbi:GPW/gp25 family protein [Castellaniella sp.]|uniref:GPW/gp25 family protein n=1 Tax=Castellaniella sp. TaxID=1955812 RepID=UPI002AFDDB4A|nr:GPW/gp25 family protein [Castellaniella sp.]